MRVHRQAGWQTGVSDDPAADPADSAADDGADAGAGQRWLRLTLDPTRLAVIGQLAIGPRTALEIAAATDLDERAVLGVLGVVVSAEFAEVRGGRYHLHTDRLRALGSARTGPKIVDASVYHGMTDDEQVVLGRFFSGTRLTQIPLHRSKRRIVLERLSLDFEPGVVYPEAVVNETLARRHPDYASLRRYLVDEGYLQRGEGKYWRSGGRVDAGGFA